MLCTKKCVDQYEININRLLVTQKKQIQEQIFHFFFFNILPIVVCRASCSLMWILYVLRKSHNQWNDVISQLLKSKLSSILQLTTLFKFNQIFDEITFYVFRHTVYIVRTTVQFIYSVQCSVFMGLLSMYVETIETVQSIYECRHTIATICKRFCRNI